MRAACGGEGCGGEGCGGEGCGEPAAALSAESAESNRRTAGSRAAMKARRRRSSRRGATAASKQPTRSAHRVRDAQIRGPAALANCIADSTRHKEGTTLTTPVDGPREQGNDQNLQHPPTIAPYQLPSRALQEGLLEEYEYHYQTVSVWCGGSRPCRSVRQDAPAPRSVRVRA